MKKLIDTTGEAKALCEMIHQFNDDPEVRSIMILCCDENGITAESVEKTLKQCHKSLWGGIFPKILEGSQVMEKGSILIGFSQESEVVTITGLSNPEEEYESIMEPLYNPSLEEKTMFVYVDGLSTRIADLKDALFDSIGLEPNYIGGGAGSLSFERKPCIFTKEGLLADVAIIASVDIRSGVGVAHGWKPVTDMIRVTQAEQNRIMSLNWRPAFEVYREIVEQQSGKKFVDTAFFELAKAYPLGIQKVAGEMIVRDPIKTLEDGSIICVGEVPVNTFISVLTGDTESLLEGASEARLRAEESYQNYLREVEKKKYATVFIDCISRVLFLENDFKKELECVQTQGLMIGALTLGEIANTGKTYLEFYNKTSVVGLMED